MNTGDVIDIEIAELNRSSMPISVEKFFPEREKSNQEKSDEMWAKDLADYYALEIAQRRRLFIVLGYLCCGRFIILIEKGWYMLNEII